MTDIECDSEEYDRIQNTVGGVIKWLKVRGSEQYSIKDLIEEVELCGENGEFPWEVMNE